MTTEMHHPPTTSPARRSHRAWLPWLVAGIAVLVIAAIAVVVVVAQDDGGDTDGTVAGTRQLASVQQACTQWHETYTGSPAPPSSWCTDMAGWMGGQMNNGQMMGAMMWGDPDRMRATCDQWMATNSAASGSQDASGWCDQMVGWMTQTMGDWDDWMMNSR